MAIWDTLKSSIVAVGVGEATADALTPILTPAAQEAWTKNPYKALAASVAAELVAQGLTSVADAQTEAGLTGINHERLQALIQAAMAAPGVPELLTLWRRNLIGEREFEHGIRKAMLEPAWDAPLEALKDEILPPAVLALAVVRGLVPSEGTLLVDPPSEAGKVKAYPVQPIPTLAEAAGAGYDAERFKVLVGINGRPMSLHEAASAYFRGIITLADYHRAVSEGDIRNEWRDAILDQAREIPSTTNFVEGFVRNWISRDQMLAGAARHGMSEADAQLLFLTHGRPLTHSQVFIGLLRGGIYDGPTTEIPAPFLKSLQESDMRPEWYHLTWAARYHFPPFFQTVNLLNKGLIDAATATHWLTVQGYDPEAIATVIGNLAGVAPKKTKTLTAAQVKKAFRGGQITERSDALQRIEADGYSAADAAIYLDS